MTFKSVSGDIVDHSPADVYQLLVSLPELLERGTNVGDWIAYDAWGLSAGIY